MHATSADLLVGLDATKDLVGSTKPMTKPSARVLDVRTGGPGTTDVKSDTGAPTSVTPSASLRPDVGVILSNVEGPTAPEAPAAPSAPSGPTAPAAPEGEQGAPGGGASTGAGATPAGGTSTAAATPSSGSVQPTTPAGAAGQQAAAAAAMPSGQHANLAGLPSTSTARPEGIGLPFLVLLILGAIGWRRVARPIA